MTFDVFLRWAFVQRLPKDIVPLLMSFGHDPPHPCCEHLLMRSNTFKNLQVEQISCGDSHGAFLLGDRRLFTFGLNAFGQLGHPPKELECPRHKIAHLAMENIEMVVCGNTFTVCASAKCVYFAGGYKCHPVSQHYSPLIASIPRFKILPYHSPQKMTCGKTGTVLLDYKYAKMLLYICPTRTTITHFGRDYNAVHGELCGFGRCVDFKNGVLVIGTPKKRIKFENVEKVETTQKLVVAASKKIVRILFNDGTAHVKTCDKTPQLLKWKNKIYIYDEQKTSVVESSEHLTCAACARGGNLLIYNECCFLHRDCAALCYILCGVCPCGHILQTSTYVHV